MAEWLWSFQPNLLFLRTGGRWPTFMVIDRRPWAPCHQSNPKKMVLARWSPPSLDSLMTFWLERTVKGEFSRSNTRQRSQVLWTRPAHTFLLFCPSRVDSRALVYAWLVWLYWSLKAENGIQANNVISQKFYYFGTKWFFHMTFHSRKSNKNLWLWPCCSSVVILTHPGYQEPRMACSWVKAS